MESPESPAVAPDTQTPDPANVPPAIPVKEPRVHRFTKENAAAFGKLGTAARERRRQSEKQAIAAIASAKAAAYPAGSRAALVAEQIVRTRKELNSEYLEPRERAQLLIALDRLLDRERVLMGVPNPGQLRPSREKTQRKAPFGTGAGPMPLDAAA